MKHRDFIAFAAFAIAAFTMLTIASCASLQKAVVSLPPQDIACVLDEADRGLEAERILIDCHLPGDALSFVKDLLAGQKAAVARKAARHAPAKDAGAE